MSGVNRVTLLGNLGKDPEIKHLDGGSVVCNFPLATSEKWKDKQGNTQEQVEWHNVVIWGKLAEICEKYLKKGASVYLEGKIRTRSWEKEGVKRYTTEIVCDQMVMLGGKKEGSGGAAEGSLGNGKTDNDDLPF